MAERHEIEITAKIDAAQRRIRTLTSDLDQLGGKSMVKATREANKLEREIKLLSGTAGGLSQIFTRFTNGIAIGNIVANAATSAFHSLGRVLADSVKAGMESEQVWNDVTASLKRHKIEVGYNIKVIKDFASTIQNQTSISDEVIGKSVQAFIDYGATVEQAMRRTKIATDLSIGASIDLKAATDLLAKASVGYTGTLSRYGIILDETIPKAQRFEMAMAQIEKRFGGAAAARMQTTAGQLELLTQTWLDFEEILYSTASGTLANGLQLLTGFIAGFNQEMTALTDSKNAAAIRAQALAMVDMVEYVRVGGATFAEMGRIMYDVGRAAKNGIEINMVDPLLAIIDVIKAGGDALTWFGAAMSMDKQNMQEMATKMAVSAANAVKHLDDAAGRFGGDLGELEKVMDGLNPENMAIRWATSAASAAAAAQAMRNAILGVNEVANGPAPQTMTQSLVAGWNQVDNSLSGYEHHMLQVWELGEEAADEYSSYVVGVEEKTTKSRVALINQMPLAWGDATRKSTVRVDQFGRDMASNLQSSGARAVAGITGELELLDMQAKTVFGKMALHFTQYFVEAALQSVALRLVGSIGGGGILGLLGGLFDTPANDRMAMREGERFGQFFSDAAVKTVAAAQIGPAIAMNAISPVSGSGAVSIPRSSYQPSVSPGGSGVSVVINVGGSVVAERDLVDRIVPVIEQAVRRSRSDLRIASRNLTGDRV